MSCNASAASLSTNSLTIFSIVRLPPQEFPSIRLPLWKSVCAMDLMTNRSYQISKSFWLQQFRPIAGWKSFL